MSEPTGGAEKAPWDRMDGEPMLWFNRFEQFRLMGPERTMVDVYRKTKSARSRKETARYQKGNVPEPWSKNAKKWAWRERAEAWDEHEMQRAREKYEEMIEEEREGRLQMIVASRRMLARELQEMVRNPDKLRTATLTQVTTAMELVFRLQREEFGEYQTTRLEISGPDGGAVQSEQSVRVSPNELSSEMLEELFEKIKAKSAAA